MTQEIVKPTPPRGLMRFLYRLPIWLYRLRLGWLLGKRFLLLNHTGRKSGLPRKNVLEIVNYDPKNNVYTLASGYGTKSQWYQNLKAQPDTTIKVGSKIMPVHAEFLSAEESGEEMVQYAQRNPTAARELLKMVGHKPDGTPEKYRRIATEAIPFIRLLPR